MTRTNSNRNYRQCLTGMVCLRTMLLNWRWKKLLDTTWAGYYWTWLSPCTRGDELNKTTLGESPGPRQCGRSSDLQAQCNLPTRHRFPGNPQCFMMTFVPVYRCATVPDFHRIPFSHVQHTAEHEPHAACVDPRKSAYGQTRYIHYIVIRRDNATTFRRLLQFQSHHPYQSRFISGRVR